MDTNLTKDVGAGTLPLVAVVTGGAKGIGWATGTRRNPGEHGLALPQ